MPEPEEPEEPEEEVVVDVLNDGDVPWGLPSLTHEGVTYIVTGWTGGKPGVEGYDSKGQLGVPKGATYRRTKATAQMTFQIPTAASALPAQFDKITYRSKDWYVLSVSPSEGYEQEPTFSMELAEKLATT